MNIMPPVIHSHEEKRSGHFERESRIGKTKSSKECQGGNRKFVFFEDIVIFTEDNEANLPKAKAVQKRRLSEDDNWDWAPYPRRLKSTHDVSLYDFDGYMSDECEASQMVPDWGDGEQERTCLMPFDDDDCEGSLNSMAADIRIVTIDEDIEFDSSKSPGGHDFEELVCFDNAKLCEIVGPEGVNEEDYSTIDNQENTIDVLRTFTNKCRLARYGNQEKPLEEAKLTEPFGNGLFDCNDSGHVDDQWQSDSQTEQFKRFKCFECKKKVYIMQDCPRHLKR